MIIIICFYYVIATVSFHHYIFSWEISKSCFSVWILFQTVEKGVWEGVGHVRTQYLTLPWVLTGLDWLGKSTFLVDYLNGGFYYSGSTTLSQTLSHGLTPSHNLLFSSFKPHLDAKTRLWNFPWKNEMVKWKCCDDKIKANSNKISIFTNFCPTSPPA